MEELVETPGWRARAMRGADCAEAIRADLADAAATWAALAAESEITLVFYAALEPAVQSGPGRTR